MTFSLVLLCRTTARYVSSAVPVITRCSSSAKQAKSWMQFVLNTRTVPFFLEWNTVVSGQPKLIMLKSSCCPPASALLLYGNTFQHDHYWEPMRTGITRRCSKTNVRRQPSNHLCCLFSHFGAAALKCWPTVMWSVIHVQYPVSYGGWAQHAPLYANNAADDIKGVSYWCWIFKGEQRESEIYIHREFISRANEGYWVITDILVLIYDTWLLQPFFNYFQSFNSFVIVQLYFTYELFRALNAWMGSLW